MSAQEYNNEHIQTTLRTTTDNWKNIVEIRILNAKREYTNNYGKVLVPHNSKGYFGYFDNGKSVVEELKSIKYAEGIYFVMNPVKQELLGRSYNKLSESARGFSTSDVDVISRSWLLVDIDPNRSSKISSTDDQHEYTKLKAKEVGDYMMQQGFQTPLFANSGNGHHLLFRVDLPAVDDGLVKGVLVALGEKFNDGKIKIDTSVDSPGNLCKLYGTKATKGDEIPELKMFHRLSTISVPSKIITTSTDVMERMAGSGTVSQSTNSMDSKVSKRETTKIEGKKTYKINVEPGFDLTSWLDDHNVGYKENGRRDNFSIYELDKCPFHTDHSAFVYSFDSGSCGFNCYHDRCVDRTWKDFKEKVAGLLPAQPGQIQIDEWADRKPSQAEIQTPWDNTPVKLYHVKAKKLTREMVPSLVYEFSKDVAGKINTHIEFVANSMLIVAATCIGRKFNIKTTDTFEIFCNNYGLLIGDSSYNKSKPMKVAMEPLRKLDLAEHQIYKDNIKLYQENLDNLSAKKVQTEANIKKESNKKLDLAVEKIFIDGPSKSSLLEDDLREVDEKLNMLKEPTQKFHYFDDTSESALINAMSDNPNGLLFFLDEASELFESFNQTYNEKLKSLLLKAWEGDSEKRPMRGGIGAKKSDQKRVFIPAMVISILASVQPEIYAKFLEKRINITSGFAPRVQMVVWPDRSNEPYVQNKNKFDKNLQKQYFEVIEKLYKYPEYIEDGMVIPRSVRFTPAAQVKWDLWHVRLNNWIMDPDLSSVERSHFKKYDYLMPSLCLIFHLFENAIKQVEDCMQEIGPDTVDMAIHMVEFYASHAVKMFGLSETEMDSNNNLILLLNKIKLETDLNVKLTKNIFTRQVRHQKYGDVEHGLRELEKFGWIRYSSKPQTTTKYLELNPIFDEYYPDGTVGYEEGNILFSSSDITESNLDRIVNGLFE
jgi:hypothetical protein